MYFINKTFKSYLFGVNFMEIWLILIYGFVFYKLKRVFYEIKFKMGVLRILEVC